MGDAANASDDTLERTPLFKLHEAAAAKFAPFAGYEMPIQYAGILAEHRQTREAAGLFDVSHMGQAQLSGPSWDKVAAALEALTPSDIAGLKPGQMRYTVLLNDDGGIIDDLMVTRPLDGDGMLKLIVNAGRKHHDYKVIRAALPPDVQLETYDAKALIALQGPKAAQVLARHCSGPDQLTFMTAGDFKIGDIAISASRSGYTGEDGYEISVAAAQAEELWRLLDGEVEVAPAGLGARDSLRLEAGLCLYGSDIDETTSPVEAAISWVIAKSRREPGAFPGSDRILRELAEKPSRKRIGLKIEGRAPARHDAPILSAAGEKIGIVTSGTVGPTIQAPIAMGYVPPEHAAKETKLKVEIRSKRYDATVTPMPFVAHSYHR